MIECEILDEHLREHAVTLINSVWHGINWDNVGSRRRMRIYDEFTNKIRSAAHSGRISKFYDKLCRSMDSNPPELWGKRALDTIKDIEENKYDLDILELILSETQYLVLLMREQNDELKTDKKQQKLGV
ncbi:hypothetical protein B6U67_03395 [Methanosarcinales archaeon ex4484_138]|nr:MAG: hypothetical protein B6U67_03395 [Methanosarcinales archaeon ex4484_138]